MYNVHENVGAHYTQQNTGYISNNRRVDKYIVVYCGIIKGINFSHMHYIVKVSHYDTEPKKQLAKGNAF